MSLTRPTLWPWLLWLSVGALWELAGRAGHLNPVLLPTPSRIAHSLFALLSLSDFYRDLGYSLGVFFAGLFLAVFLGTFFGLLGGFSAGFFRALSPFLFVVNALPKVALLPLLVLWMGIGPQSGVTLAALMAGFPILLSVHSGVQALEGDLLEMARSFGARPRLLIFSLIVPGILPYLFSGLKVGVSYALVAVILAEFFASGRGLGHRLLLYMSNFQVAHFFACLCLIAALALLFAALLGRIEQKLLHWRSF